MKASHIFLFGVIFGMVYHWIDTIISGDYTIASSYTYWEVILLVMFITIWYSIDRKLNKTYQVTKWN